MSAPNAAFMPYASGLVRLHDLIRRGEGDSDRADGLRDVLDGLWDRLDPEDVARVHRFSADLESLGDERGSPRGSPLSERHSVELRDAEAQRDWDRALELVRQQAPDLPPPQVAFLRGVYWSNLGGAELALPFLEDAASRAPGTLPVFLLTLSQLGLYEELARLVMTCSQAEPPALPIPDRLVVSVRETLRLHEQLRELRSRIVLTPRGDSAPFLTEFSRIRNQLDELRSSIAMDLATLAA